MGTEMSEIIQQAQKHVEEYLNRRFTESLERITKEIHGDGCGCNQCARMAVDDINKYVDLITHDGADDLHFGLTFINGYAEIVPPEEPK